MNQSVFNSCFQKNRLANILQTGFCCMDCLQDKFCKEEFKSGKGKQRFANRNFFPVCRMSQRPIIAFLSMMSRTLSFHSCCKNKISRIRATSHKRLRACVHYITCQALSLEEKAEPVQVHLRDQGSMWMQDGCKVYMDSYMASNGSCFMVTWSIFKNHLLEEGLTQNQETMALWTLITVDLLYFNMREDPHE